MDDLDWRIMSLISSTKSLARIADELFLSQPALTYRIRKIEKYFESELIQRTNKGFKITEQGKIVADYAMSHLSNVKQIHEDIYSIENKVKGPLNIGASSAIAQYLLPSLLSDFLSYNNEVIVDLVTGFSPYLIDQLNTNQIHIAFLREDIEWTKHKKHLASDGIYLVSKEPTELDNLPKMTRVNYKTNLSLKYLIDNWWKNNFNRPPKSIIEVDNAEACKEVVRSGLGYSILTGLTLNNQNDLYCVPLSNDRLDLKRNIWMYATEDAMKYVTVKSFWNFIDSQKTIYHGK